MTYMKAILALLPDARFGILDNDLSTLEWLDDRDKPSDADIEAKLQELIAGQPLADLRQQRNWMLQASDWTQGADVPDTIKTPWAAYRQALRDITDTYSSLDDVVWPTKPE